MRFNIQMRLAGWLAGPSRAKWLDAMQAESKTIIDSAERQKFEAGCFQALLLDFVRSRRGLSLMARGGGALFIILMSGYGFGVALKSLAGEWPAAASYLIGALCVFYAICGGLLMMSLRGLRTAALAGFAAAVMGRLYITFATPQFAGLGDTFLSALALEMAGLMTGLFVASVYLSWLYDPNADA